MITNQVKQKETGKSTFFNVKREEIGRVKLVNGIELIVSLVNDEHLDMRLGVDRYPYQGLRFYLPEVAYKELKKLIDKVDKELGLRGILDPGEHNPLLSLKIHKN